MTFQKYDCQNERSPEHHVAMDVNGLLSMVINVWGHTQNPSTRMLVERDRRRIADAYDQLGKLVLDLYRTEEAA